MNVDGCPRCNRHNYIREGVNWFCRSCSFVFDDDGQVAGGVCPGTVPYVGLCHLPATHTGSHRTRAPGNARKP